MKITASHALALLALATAKYNGGTIKLYNGAVPANPETPLTTQTLLVTFNCAATAFGTPTTSTDRVSADLTPPAAQPGVASMAAQFWRAFDSTGAVFAQGTLGLSGSGADIEVADLNVSVGVNVSLLLYRLSQYRTGI